MLWDIFMLLEIEGIFWLLFSHISNNNNVLVALVLGGLNYL